jgi:hypothetical protein
VNVTVTYYGSNPPNIGPYTHTGINIPPGASKTIDLSSSTSEPNLPSTPAGLVFIGSGIVTSDPGMPVGVVVNHNAAGSLTSQLGFVSTDAATTWFFPQLYRNVADPNQGYIFGSSIQVMKPDPTNATPVNVQVTYFNTFTGHTKTESGTLDSTHKYLNFDQRGAYSALAGTEDPFYGSATVVAGAPVVATANLVSNFTVLGGRATTYRAPSSASGTNQILIPLVMKNYYDAGTGIYYSTAFQVRTTTGGSGTVNITFYYTEGGVQKTYSLAPINVSPSVTTFTIDQRPAFCPYLPNGSIASVVLNSTTPIAATVNMVGANGTPGDGSATYNGVNP